MTQQWTNFGGLTTPYRLPSTIIPTHYNLILKPDFQRNHFKGHVDISIDVHRDSKNVILNSELLNIYGSIRLKSNDRPHDVLEDQGIYYDRDYNLTNIMFGETLKKGSKMTLSIQFMGNISQTDSDGFFRSPSLEEDPSRHLYLTSLERNYARRLLPCWDEPEFKATFQVTIEVPSHLTVLSNTDSNKKAVKKNGNKEIRFKKTPLMSTYLLAVRIGELHYIEGEYSSVLSGKSVRCRVYSLREPNEAMKFILGTAIKSLDYFERLFDMPLESPKLDFVMVPGYDWPMENWGLITLSDKLELDFDSSESLIVAARKVAHEIAHHWFGNLVTIKWWSDLWIKEGFAVYFELLAIDSIYPEYKVLSDFYDNDMMRLLSTEDEKMTPLHIEIIDPRKMDETFVEESYIKSTIIFSMTNKIITQTKFNSFIRSYLKRFKYQSITADDFYSELSSHSSQDLEHFFDTWVKRKERPYLEVTESDGKKADDVIVTIAQRFSGNKIEQYLFWPLSIKLMTFEPTKTNRTILLLSPETQIKVKKDKAYFIYPDEDSYYRVQYSKSSIRKLRPYFERKVLGVKERSRLVEDAGVIFRNTHSSFPLLDLFPILTKEDDNDVIGDINFETYALFSFWSNRPDLDTDFHRLKQKLYLSLYNNRTLAKNLKDATHDPNLQLYVMRNLVLTGNNPILYEAEELFAKFKKDPTIWSSGVERVMFLILLSQYAGDNLPEVLAILPDESDDANFHLRETILDVLVNCHPNLFPQILEWGLDNDQILTVYHRLVDATASHQKLALHFLINHWSHLQKKFTAIPLLPLLTDITSQLATLDAADQLSKFVKINLPSLPIHPVVNAIISRSEIIRRDGESVRRKLLELNGKDDN